MKYSKPSKNSAKQMLKLLKHFYEPVEEWWELPLNDGRFLSYESWVEGLNSLKQISVQPRKDWDEKELFLAVKKLQTTPYANFKKQKMQEYRNWYQSMIEQGIQEALDDSEHTGNYFLGQPEYDFHFKALTSVKISERKAAVLSDCYISRTGMIIFLRTKTFFPTTGRFPKEIRSAYRSGYGMLRGSRIRLCWYYRDKSEHNQKIFSFRQRTTEGVLDQRLTRYARYLLKEEISLDKAILLAGLGYLLGLESSEQPILTEILEQVEKFSAEIQNSVAERWLGFSAGINQRFQENTWVDLIVHSYFMELGCLEFLGISASIERNVLWEKIHGRWRVMIPLSRTLREMYSFPEGSLQDQFLLQIENA